MQSRKRTFPAPSSTGSLLQLMTISLFVILLAFFILLNSIAVLNEQKVVAAIGSLLGSFGQKTGGYSVIDGTGEKNLIVPVTTYTGRIDFSDLIVEDTALAQQIQILTSPRGSLVRIPAHQFFAEAAATIRSPGRAILDRMAAAIRKNRFPVEISCHTDNQPIAKSRVPSNREITALRALSIFRYITEERKIDADRLIAFGWGEFQPAYSNRNRQTRRLNNRVEFLFVHKLRKEKPKGGFIFKDFFFRSFE